ncbi:TetR/AcrR family transcriptional regulator [Dactylosporangium sp. NPDC051541]|uniref:TetR/AcrR family transcriptional regulator n=1 Tax=Dactylosporangium sp. NPDC051541 TaxID=3363977 RepID=UPI00378F2F49
MTGSKSALLDAATAEFAKHGLRGTRIQSIVKRAGVNERMIYHHFGSKDGLYRAVLDAQWASMREAWAPVLIKSVTLPPGEAMRTALAGLFDAVSDRPLLVGLAIHEALAGWPTRPLPNVETLPPPLRMIYEKGQEQGVFRADCPFEVAYGVALGSLFLLPVMGPRFTEVMKSDPTGSHPSQELRDQIIEQVIDGMTGPAKAG